MSAGFLAVNSISNFEHLCALDVHELADTLARDQQEVHKEFREQMARHREEGWYETGLPRPEKEIIHLCPLIKKVVCIDCTFSSVQITPHGRAARMR